VNKLGTAESNLTSDVAGEGFVNVKSEDEVVASSLEPSFAGSAENDGAGSG